MFLVTTKENSSVKKDVLYYRDIEIYPQFKDILKGGGQYW